MPLYVVHCKVTDLNEIFSSTIIVLDPRVEFISGFLNVMRGIVITAITNVKSSEEGKALINDYELLMVRPIGRQDYLWMPEDFDVLMKGLESRNRVCRIIR